MRGASLIVQHYDVIGANYTLRRHADPRIAAQIDRALGDARRVLNVGAGTGSYEPTDRFVMAVEPSRVMIDQRPPNAARAIQAVAEALPFRDGAFDAAIAVLSVHHWQDPQLGLREMRRVAFDRVVLLTWDVEVGEGFWLTRDYFPGISAWDRRRMPSTRELSEWLSGAEETAVPVPFDCVDGFLGAFWGRPEAYLDPAVHRGISTFALLDATVVETGLRQLEDDLRSGAWDAKYGELRRLASLDVGYRLLVARGGSA